MASIRKAASLLAAGATGALLPVVGYKLGLVGGERGHWRPTRFINTSMSAGDLRTLDSGSVEKWDSDWDRRSSDSYAKFVIPYFIEADSDLEEQTPVPQPSATRHIYFVRHGHYNIDGVGDAEQGLSELGRKQAIATGKRLQSLNIKFDKVVNSTMTRAQETADCILNELSSGATLPRTEDPLLEEGAPCVPQPFARGWKVTPYEFLTEGIRIDAGFYKYFHRADPSQERDSHELFVGHGNVIRYFVCKALQFPKEGWLRMSLAHGSVTKFTIRPSGTVTVASVGDAGFQPPGQVTYYVESKISQSM